MATLRCKSCGRVYSYEKNGTCPKCGAYNRPPRKEIVEPDGSIHYVTTENKVCYEEEECHESAVRHSTNTYDYTPQSPIGRKSRNKRAEINAAANRLRQKRNDLSANDRKKLLAILGAVCAVISLISTLVGNLSGENREPVDEPWESVSVEPAERLFNLLAHVGGVIYTDSGAVTIDSYEQTDRELKFTLLTKVLDFDLILDCYYETPIEHDHLEMTPLFFDGERYTFVAALPDGITASDCAVVLDIPFEAGINRYWIWLETPTYEMDEDFYLNGQRLFVSEVRQSRNGVDVSIDCEWDVLSGCDATLTALNVNGQPYTASLQSAQCTINMTDGRNTSLLNFTLRNENDTAHSITLRDNETQRQVTVNLQP